MTREDMPTEIKSLIAQCEGNVSSFTNDQMSAALHFAETLANQLEKPIDRQLIDACNLLCEYAIDRLPEGFELVLSVEDGEATLSLFDADCNDVEFENGDREISSWREAIETALDRVGKLHTP